MASEPFLTRVGAHHFVWVGNAALLKRNGQSIDERVKAIRNPELRKALVETWDTVKLAWAWGNEQCTISVDYIQAFGIFSRERPFLKSMAGNFADSALDPGILAGQFQGILTEVEWLDGLDGPEDAEGDVVTKKALRERYLSHLREVDSNCHAWLQRENEGMAELENYRRRWFFQRFFRAQAQAQQSLCTIQ